MECVPFVAGGALALVEPLRRASEVVRHKVCRSVLPGVRQGPPGGAEILEAPEKSFWSQPIGVEGAREKFCRRPQARRKILPNIVRGGAGGVGGSRGGGLRPPPHPPPPKWCRLPKKGPGARTCAPFEEGTLHSWMGGGSPIGLGVKGAGSKQLRELGGELSHYALLRREWAGEADRGSVRGDLRVPR